MSQVQSHMQGDPQPARNWRKPRRSFANGNCVEAGDGHSAVAVRDSKLGGAGPVLAFTPAAWREFTSRLRGR